MTSKWNENASTGTSSNSIVYIAGQSLDMEPTITRGRVISIGRKNIVIEIPDAVYTEAQNADGLKNTFKRIKMPFIRRLSGANVKEYIDMLFSSNNNRLPHYIVYAATPLEARGWFSRVMSARAEYLAEHHRKKDEQNKQDEECNKKAQTEADRLHDVIESIYVALNNGRDEDAFNLAKSEVEKKR